MIELTLGDLCDLCGEWISFEFTLKGDLKLRQGKEQIETYDHE
jgi:hypothetical protein